MRYGNPSIESELLKLAAIDGVDEVLFIPLYPHFADSTVKTSIVEAQRVIDKHGLDIRLNVFEPFYQRDDYINALVASTKAFSLPAWNALKTSWRSDYHLSMKNPMTGKPRSEKSRPESSSGGRGRQATAQKISRTNQPGPPQSESEQKM